MLSELIEIIASVAEDLSVFWYFWGWVPCQSYYPAKFWYLQNLNPKPYEVENERI